MLVLEDVAAGIKDGRELFAMGAEEEDEGTLLSVKADNAGIEAKVAALEFRRMFNNPSDPMRWPLRAACAQAEPLAGIPKPPPLR